MKFILASTSPRRKDLLSYVLKDFEIISSNFDEEKICISNPKKLVRTLAKGKCENVFEKTSGDRCVVGADTIVFLNNKIMGKPKNEESAREMLRDLSNKWNKVLTAVCIKYQKKDKIVLKSFVCVSKVLFKDLSNEEIDEYIETKEPFDKAGGYAIQGFARKFIKTFKGSLNNIIGLPTTKLLKTLFKEDLFKE